MLLKELIKTVKGTVIYVGERKCVVQDGNKFVLLQCDFNKIEYVWQKAGEFTSIEECGVPTLVTKPNSFAELEEYCYQYCLTTMMNLYKEGKLGDAVSIFYPLDHDIVYCFGTQVINGVLYTANGEEICAISITATKIFDEACNNAYTEFSELIDDDEDDSMAKYEEKAENEYNKRTGEDRKWL